MGHSSLSSSAAVLPGERAREAPLPSQRVRLAKIPGREDHFLRRAHGNRLVFYRIVYPAIRARGDLHRQICRRGCALRITVARWLTEAFGLGAEEAEKSRLLSDRIANARARQREATAGALLRGNRPPCGHAEAIARPYRWRRSAIRIARQGKTLFLEERTTWRTSKVPEEAHHHQREAPACATAPSRASSRPPTRRVKDAVAAGNGKPTPTPPRCAACRLMDKAATKGVIHKNQAANRKSGIMLLMAKHRRDRRRPRRLREAGARRSRRRPAPRRPRPRPPARPP